jgi:rod shape-determining protein MreC
VQVDPGINYVSGRVVSDNGGPFVDTVIVNVGRDQGAKSGDAVIDTDGLIGRIVSTGERAARVLLLTDLNSRMPVVIEPGHYKAVLAGDNTKWPRLDYLLASSSAAPGDRVVTSGDGGLIPPGLPVGLVIKTSDGILRVQSFANRERLDFVRVLKYAFPTQVQRQDPPEVLKGPPISSTPAPTGVPPLPSSEPLPVKRKAPPVKPVTPSVVAKKPVAAKPATMKPIPDPADTEEVDAPPPPGEDVTPGGSDTAGTE